MSISLIFSMYTVGQIAGSLFSGQIADRFGRRAGMFTGCFIILIGTSVIASSNSMRQFVAGLSSSWCYYFSSQLCLASPRAICSRNGNRGSYYSRPFIHHWSRDCLITHVTKFIKFRVRWLPLSGADGWLLYITRKFAVDDTKTSRCGADNSVL